MKEQYSLMDSDDLIRFRESWKNVLKRLSPEIPAQWFERFIRPLTPHSLHNETAVLKAPGSFVKEWIESRYQATIEQILSDEIGRHIRIEFLSEPRTKAEAQAPASTPQVVPQEDHKFKPIERYAFDSFVVGQSNRMAFAGAKAVANNPGQTFNPLFIYGQSGLGKTHLLHSIAKQILAENPTFPLVYVTAQQFAEEFVSALQNGRTEQFRRAQRNVGMWLVDDIQFVAGKDKTSEEVFHTFNHLHSLGKQIVLCSDRPPRDLYSMDERLRSRFESGLVADIQMPDTETRSAILLSKAALERVDLPLQIAMLMAESVPGNIRVLEGALTKLVVQASITNQPISIELATEMIEQYYRIGTLAKPGINQIVEAVGKHYKIDSREIRGISRKAPIVHARHIAVYITREITKDSWKHIGSMFGDRDHTSMMHGYQKISELMNQDKDLRATIRMLIRNLYPEA